MRPESANADAGERACRVRDRERAIHALARRQHAVVSRRQLLKLGLSPETVKRRLRNGRLRALHRGVYLVGPVAPPFARQMAAVLACRGDAVISHASAAALWKILSYPAAVSSIDVTISGRNPGNRPGIRIHRTRALDSTEIRLLVGIPLTSPARTLLDLAAARSIRELEQATAEAFALKLTTSAELLSLIARHPARPGTHALRDMIEVGDAPSRLRSEAERRLLALIRKARLPKPEVNVRLHGFEVDFVWRKAQVVVEVDGYAFHANRPKFERDRHRDVELAARGFRVVRVSWRQITGEPEALVARLAATLG